MAEEATIFFGWAELRYISRYSVCPVLPLRAAVLPTDRSTPGRRQPRVQGPHVSVFLSWDLDIPDILYLFPQGELKLGYLEFL